MFKKRGSKDQKQKKILDLDGIQDAEDQLVNQVVGYEVEQEEGESNLEKRP